MPVEYKDYYKTLGVSKSASAEEIKRAYRKLARQHHPDVNKKPEAEKRFKEINEANEVLSDPEKRKRYDAVGPEWERFRQGGQQPGGDPFNGEAGGFSDFFRTLFGEGAADFDAGPLFGRPSTRRRRAVAGTDIEHDVEITLAEAYKGTERSVELRLPDGTTRRLSVKIPAGVRDGRRIRLAGQGMPRATGGHGDLYVTVKVVLPTKLNEKERDLVRELAASRAGEDPRKSLL